MRAPAWLAMVLAGAILAIGAYAVGRHDREPRPQHGLAKAFSDETGRHYVYTLRDGDIALRPEAGARCLASGEAGRRNLFCTRIGGGRHQIIFYRDDILVWPLDCPACGPDGPVYTYRWAEKLTTK